MQTRDEVEKLKMSWCRDPIWDIETTEGFEEYRDELFAYRKECEQKWEQNRQKKIEEEKAEAEKLGLYGLYQKIKELEELQERHDLAITYLTEGNSDAAYKALKGRLL
jgi:hypothetical protein